MLSSFIFFILYFFTLLCNAKTDFDAIELQENEIDAFIAENNLVLINFYAKWCNHCNNFKGDYRKIAQNFQGNPDVKIAKIDAGSSKEVASKYDISGFPTLTLFYKKHPYKYSGNRSVEDVIYFVERFNKETIIPVKNVQEAFSQIRKGKPFFVAEIKAKNDDAYNMYKQTADGQRLTSDFFAIINESFDKERLSAYHENTNPRATINIESQAELDKFVTKYNLPLFGEITVNNYSNYVAQNKPLTWFFARKADFQKYYDSIAKAAAEVIDDTVFVWLDSDEHSRHTKAQIGLEPIPTLLYSITDDRQYKLNGVDFNSDDIIAFIKGSKAGTVEVFARSQDIPKTNDEPVKIVVGKTFNDMVLNNKKDVLLEVYADWCGHCESFAPKYVEFAKSMASNTNLIVAKIEATYNKIPENVIKVSGFPSIYLFKPGGKAPIEYFGDRSPEALAQFYEENKSSFADEPTTEAPKADENVVKEEPTANDTVKDEL